jgi:hypothetical protein
MPHLSSFSPLLFGGISVWGDICAVRSVWGHCLLRFDHPLVASLWLDLLGALSLRFDLLGVLSLRFDPFGGVFCAVQSFGGIVCAVPRSIGGTVFAVCAVRSFGGVFCSEALSERLCGSIIWMHCVCGLTSIITAMTIAQ